MRCLSYGFLILTLGLMQLDGVHAEVIALNFEDLPKLLLERNQNIQGSQLTVQASEKRTGHLVRSYLPTLLFDAGGEHFQTGSYPIRTEPYAFLETRLNVFRGGKDALEENIRQSYVRLTHAQAQRTLIEELTDARKIFWHLIFQREIVQILKEALNENEKNLASAKRRTQRGLTSDTDQLDFEINRDVLNEEIGSLEHDVELTQIKLRSFFSWSDEKIIQTLNHIPHDHDEALLKMEIPAESNPEVSWMKANSEISLNQGNQANRWWTPSVDIYAGYYLYTLRDRDYVDITRRDDTIAGIRLSFPLFDGLQSKHLASALSLQSEALDMQARQKEKTIQARLKIAKEEIKHHHELTHVAESRIEMGVKYFQKTLSEYDRGIKNSPDVLGALQRKIVFRRRYAEIKRDYQSFKTDLLGLLNQ